jgi:uncharacterized protein (DUF924 family)
MATIEDVLTFWFGALASADDLDTSKSKLWWGGGPELDAEIKQRFGVRVAEALAGKLEAWRESPRGCLALVILLDQFTRNIGRGTPDAFEGDGAALEVSLEAQKRGFDRELRLIERAFLYMPMMHAEDREMARHSLETFERLSKEVAALGRSYPDFRSHAVTHAEIVLRFGRYPHRNDVLGRTPSSEEIAFIAEGGPSFGQEKT